MLIPLRWEIVRMNDSTVKIKGECNHEAALPNLVAGAIKMSCDAYYFDGKPCQREPQVSNSKYTLSFTIWFKKDENADDYIEHFRRD